MAWYLFVIIYASIDYFICKEIIYVEELFHFSSSFIYIYLHSMYMVIPLLRSALISFLHFGHRKDALCLNLSATGKYFWTNL
jgi:hypothetical protein